MLCASPGEETAKKRGVYVGNECERRRLPAPFHTSRELPHPPVDGGPRVQCGALPPQTSLIGEKENGEQMIFIYIYIYHLYFQDGRTVIT